MQQAEAARRDPRIRLQPKHFFRHVESLMFLLVWTHFVGSERSTRIGCVETDWAAVKAFKFKMGT